MKKKTAAVIAACILFFSALFVALGIFALEFALVRPDYSPELKYSARAEKKAKDAQPKPRAQQKRVLTAGDGLQLAADVHWAKEESHKWFIVLHGYKSNNDSTNTVATRFYLRGYNILAPDLRAHGESEGKYIGMGWLDRLDLLAWIDFIIGQDPQAQIILHGTSMGGATVLMTAGEELPENVCGIIADCGYTSVWDIFADELYAMFRLPEFPVMQAAAFVAPYRIGYDITEASTLEQVKKATVPILFIHGEEDDLVHVEMAYELYEACPTQKQLLIVEGAGHATSYRHDSTLYFDTVFAFINEHCIPE